MLVRGKLPPPPVITNLSGPTGSSTQVGISFSMTPTVVGGALPLTFSMAGPIVGGLSVNPSTGVISGTPNGTSGESYSGTLISTVLRVTDAVGREFDYPFNFFAYVAAYLGFEPSMQTGFFGTAGTRGIWFNNETPSLPNLYRVNNGNIFAQYLGRWWGPLDAGATFPGHAQFETFAVVNSGTGNSSNFGVWNGQGQIYTLSTPGSIAIEIRPVGGSSIGSTVFTFNN